MPDILSTTEGFKSKTVQELSLTEDSMSWLHAKSCFVF